MTDSGWSKLRDRANLLYDSLEDGVTSIADSVSAHGSRARDRASRATEPVVATASVVTTSTRTAAAQAGALWLALLARLSELRLTHQPDSAPDETPEEASGTAWSRVGDWWSSTEFRGFGSGWLRGLSPLSTRTAAADEPPLGEREVDLATLDPRNLPPGVPLWHGDSMGSGLVHGRSGEAAVQQQQEEKQVQQQPDEGEDDEDEDEEDDEPLTEAEAARLAEERIAAEELRRRAASWLGGGDGGGGGRDGAPAEAEAAGAQEAEEEVVKTPAAVEVAKPVAAAAPPAAASDDDDDEAAEMAREAAEAAEAERAHRAWLQEAQRVAAEELAAAELALAGRPASDEAADVIEAAAALIDQVIGQGGGLGSPNGPEAPVAARAPEAEAGGTGEDAKLSLAEREYEAARAVQAVARGSAARRDHAATLAAEADKVREAAAARAAAEEAAKAVEAAAKAEAAAAAKQEQEEKEEEEAKRGATALSAQRQRVAEEAQRVAEAQAAADQADSALAAQKQRVATEAAKMEAAKAKAQAKRDADAAAKANAPATPDLRSYGTLFVELIRARELPAAADALRDPFATLVLAGRRHRSSTARGTLSPEWRETFGFRGVLGQMLEAPLQLQLLAASLDATAPDEAIGHATVALFRHLDARPLAVTTQGGGIVELRAKWDAQRGAMAVAAATIQYKRKGVRGGFATAMMTLVSKPAEAAAAMSGEATYTASYLDAEGTLQELAIEGMLLESEKKLEFTLSTSGDITDWTMRAGSARELTEWINLLPRAAPKKRRSSLGAKLLRRGSSST